METDHTNPTSTNWYALTGGPGSGKTTTVALIASIGVRTT